MNKRPCRPFQSIARLAFIAAVCTIAFCPLPTQARDFSITRQTDFDALADQVSAGDSIVLKTGDWRDVKLKFEQLRGSEDAPIEIRAETPGKVVLTGATEFRLSGQHVTVRGLVFRDTADVSDVFQLRSHSKRLAHHCRVTECVFEESTDHQNQTESHWLSVYGTNNRVDHCYFGGKKNRGTTLVVWVNEGPEDHRIDHNHFGPRPVLGKNGGETIRIGTSEVSELDCRTVVEQNYFDRCDGEAEVVSNKSCGNIYRHNVFDQCSGALTLRHGHKCIVDGNIFFGKKQRGTGGVRIIGTGHRVINNYFEGLRGDAERAAICLMNGVRDGELHTYAPVRDAVVANNTLVDCKVSIEIGVGAGKKQSAAPTDCQFKNNLFVPMKWPLFRVHASPLGFDWTGNRSQTGTADESELVDFESIDPKLERTPDGLLRPTSSADVTIKSTSDVKHDIDGMKRGRFDLVGCDDPDTQRMTWPSPDNTGPQWPLTR